MAWPPLTVDAGSQASGGSGVTGAFGTLTRADGTTQVTYLGNPLYYWKGDTKPTDTTGEGVNGFLVAGVSGPIPNPSSSVKPLSRLLSPVRPDGRPDHGADGLGAAFRLGRATGSRTSTAV